MCLIKHYPCIKWKLGNICLFTAVITVYYICIYFGSFSTSKCFFISSCLSTKPLLLEHHLSFMKFFIYYQKIRLAAAHFKSKTLKETSLISESIIRLHYCPTLLFITIWSMTELEILSPAQKPE